MSAFSGIENYIVGIITRQAKRYRLSRLTFHLIRQNAQRSGNLFFHRTSHLYSQSCQSMITAIVPVGCRFKYNLIDSRFSIYILILIHRRTDILQCNPRIGSGFPGIKSLRNNPVHILRLVISSIYLYLAGRRSIPCHSRILKINDFPTHSRHRSQVTSHAFSRNTIKCDGTDNPIILLCLFFILITECNKQLGILGRTDILFQIHLSGRSLIISYRETELIG